MTPKESLQRFLTHLRHHLGGWKAKVEKDFAEKNFKLELKALSSDPVYSKFHLASPDYVVIRLMGRMSVSIGRRLGEIYDKIPRLAAQARYNLSKKQVIVKVKKLELDIRLRSSDVASQEDRTYVETVTKKHLDITLGDYEGLAIEIRYNFNPNDSARLRKDKQLAELLTKHRYYPVYLIFAENSPRLADAVASLTRAGWKFIIGTPALRFMADLVGFDISSTARVFGRVPVS